MKSIIFITALILSFDSAQAFSLWPIVGDGNVTVSKRKVDNFEKLVVDGSYQVSIEKGDDNTITIEGEQNLVDRTKVEVRDGKLLIFEGAWLKPRSPLLIKVKKTGLKALKAKGSSSIYWSSLSADSLELSVVGSGSLRGSVNSVQNLRVTSRGSGSVTLNGQAKYLSVSASGSSTCSFELNNVNEASIEGSGTIQCYLKDAMKVNVSLDGASVLNFGGKQSAVTSKTTGASLVKFSND